jgi:hypothetical protein
MHPVYRKFVQRFKGLLRHARSAQKKPQIRPVRLDCGPPGLAATNNHFKTTDYRAIRALNRNLRR